VSNLLAAAKASNGFKGDFAFYRRYPKTAQAAEVLKDALSRLERNASAPGSGASGSVAVASLVTIANFASQYPKALPASVKKLTRQNLYYEANKQLTDMWSSVSWCRTFVSEMLGSSQTSTSCGSSQYRDKNVSAQLNHVLSLLPALRQPSSVRSIFSSLLDANAALASIDSIMAAHGTKSNGNWTYTSSQVYETRSYTDSLSSDLASAKAGLKKLKS